MKTSLKKIDQSQVEIEFELTEEEFKKHVDRALLHLKEHVKMDGFRQGQVPLEIVEKKVGQENVLMEAGDLAVKDSYAKFIHENTIEPIGEPEVQIVKIAKGSPLVFTVKVAVLPETVLPDYKEIASAVKGQEVLVSDQEVEDAVNYLQKSRATFSQVARPAEKKDFVEIAYTNEHINGGKEVKDKFILGEGGFLKDFEDNVIGMKSGDEKEFRAQFPANTPNKDLAGKESDFKVKMVSVQKMELPAMNDAFAKSLGPFDTLEALKTNIKEGITMEKRESERQRKRGEILRSISEKITFILPQKMMDYEEKRLFEDFKNQIMQTNLPAQPGDASFEKYLASVKKTEEEIKKSFRLDAEKRIKNFLVLKEIGKAEHVEVSKEELEEEMNTFIKHYSKQEAEKIDISQLKEYTKGVVYNEKVFKLLDQLSDKSSTAH